LLGKRAWAPLCFALTAFVSLAMLSGCASSNPGKQTASVSSGVPITLEFWTLQLDTFKSTLVPMFQAYEKTHPNVRIHWVDIPFSEGPKRTLTAMMSDHVPDVVNLNPDFSAVLANRNALLDMQQVIPLTIQATYLPVAWQAATLHFRDGHSLVFGLPWYVTSSVTIYNKAILKKAGLAAPPATVDAIPDFAETVRAKTGAYGLMPVIAESGNFLKELKKIGVPLYDTQGRAMFAKPRAMDYLAHFVELYQAGDFPAEAITESHQAAIGRYQAGTLAMLSIGPNFLKIVKENAADIFKVTDVAPQFPQNAPYKDFSMMVLVVPHKSAHPKEAAEFAAFITNAQNQFALSQAAPVLPSITAALQEPYFTEIHASDLLARGRSISAQQLLSAKEAYQIRPDQNAINQIVDYYVQLAMLGKLSPSTALQRAQSDINATLSQNN
jgi:putative chitobiose transport system substrate-binding protein